MLSDAGKKQRYDAYGHGGVGGQAGGGFGGGGGNPFGAGGFAGFGFGGGQSAEDIFAQFDQMFSEAGRRQRAPRGPPRGQDVQAQVSLDFLQAVRGCKTTNPDPDPNPNPAGARRLERHATARGDQGGGGGGRQVISSDLGK